MKRIAAGLLFIAFSCISAYAVEENEKASSSSTTIEIVVIDALTDEPIPAAKVEIDKKNIETYTDFEGYVKINNIVEGSYDIVISSISYQKHQLKAFKAEKNHNRILVELQP